jgi:hypothetical protein
VVKRPYVLVVAAALLLALLGLYLVERAYDEGPNYTEIEAGLWLGGYGAAPPPGVRAVLNLCETEDGYRAEEHRWQPIADAAPAPSLDWLREQADWIDRQRREGRVVYVHCRNGVSRSAMVLAAYLMRRDALDREAALVRLRERRPIIRPNPAFLELLAEWEQRQPG